MNLYWVYEIPNWLFAALTIGFFVAFSTVGLWVTRTLMLRILGRHPHNDIVSYYLATVGVFYGITLGLIAVGTYQTYSDLGQSVSQEAASVAAIYRDVSSYPEPARSQLRGILEEYTQFVIEEAWPQQRQGIIPPGGTAHVNRLQVALATFNPSTAGETVLHAETLRQFNRLVELAGLRLLSVPSGLPTTMYEVIVLGALVNIMVSWLFIVGNSRLHVLLNVLMATLLGLLVFLIATMDNPFSRRIQRGTGRVRRGAGSIDDTSQVAVAGAQRSSKPFTISHSANIALVGASGILISIRMSRRRPIQAYSPSGVTVLPS